MCFSATASFAASIALTAIGVASVREVKEPTQYPFASIPLIFGLQQGVEGIVWLSATHSAWAGYQDVASFSFLCIAQVIWPLLFPVAFLRMEKEVSRKKILKLFMIPGIIIATYFLYCLLAFSIDTRVTNHHIFYDIDFPVTLIPIAAGFYLTATVVPPLWSRDSRIKLIGGILIAGYLVARIFFQPSLISVWCFFGITASVMIYIVLRTSKSNLIKHTLT